YQWVFHQPANERIEKIGLKAGIDELNKKEKNCKEYALVDNAESGAIEFSSQALRDFEETTNSIKRLVLDDFKQFYDSDKLNTEFKLLAEAYPKEVVEIETAKIENRSSVMKDASKSRMDSMLREQKALYDAVKTLNEKYYSANKGYMASLSKGETTFYMSQGVNPINSAISQIKRSQQKLQSAEASMMRLQENINQIALNGCKNISDNKDVCISEKRDESYKRYAGEVERYNIEAKNAKEDIIKNTEIVDSFKQHQVNDEKNKQEVINEYKKLFNLSLNNKETSENIEASTQTVENINDKSVYGIIKEYDCGDNCYLTIMDDTGRERAGLCTAQLCQQWNESSEMPVSYIGKKVAITIGKGFQYDGNGNAMGETDAFKKIELIEPNSSSATGAQWSEGFGQGNLEYFIDKDGVRLYIACPTQDGSPDAQSGVSLYRLSDEANFEKFAIDVNGHSYDGPFSADSRVGDNNFLSLLEDLRKSDAVVKFNGKVITFPKSNAANVLPIHGEKFSCNLSF
ncbi:hypothetical protein, partial [Methylomonas koyamae]